MEVSDVPADSVTATRLSTLAPPTPSTLAARIPSLLTPPTPSGLAIPTPIGLAHANELLNLEKLRIDPNWALRIPASLALRRAMMPFAMSEKKVLVACADPADRPGLDAVEKYVGMPVLPRRADPDALRKMLQRVYPDPTAPAIRPQTAAESARAPEGDDDAIGLVDEILRFAVLRQASDIHIEPRRSGMRIRLRVDGQMEELRRLPTSRQSGLVSRLKVLSGMDIAEKRAAQDGAFVWSVASLASAVFITALCCGRLV